MSKKIEQWEVERYWEIFSSLVTPGTSHLDGNQAATVLKNSRLRNDQLERVWDLADVDNDGRLDFEEFCVAMRIVFDLVNGEYADVPAQLPDWLVPESKAHLVQASRAIRGGSDPAFTRLQASIDDDTAVGSDGTAGLRDGFDWYMSPAQKSQYESIYASARDGHGYVSFTALADLYASLADSVPDTDVRSAWNLVNPAADEVIGRDAALAFLHLLQARHDGLRLPRSVPPSLRATFDRRDAPPTSVSAPRAPRPDDNTSTGRKAKFGDTYLSRLGGGRAAAAPRGTDFSGTATTSDWEEVRLKKQLRELDARMERVEAAARRRETQGGRRADSKPALVRRELEQLLDYKRRELRGLETGEGAKAGDGLKGAQEEIATVKEQVEGLEAHLRKREEALEEVRRLVQEQKGR